MLLAASTFMALLIVLVASQAVIYVRRIRFSETLVARARCARSDPSGCRRTLVVLGDSTAFGVGACEPDHSVAGRIAAAFPDARVFNYSKSGARARHVHGQLDAYPYPTADVVLVQVGANDVLGVHPVARIEVDLRAAFERARALGAVVFFMPGNNFSFAPFFVWPAQGLLCWRALRIHAMVQRLVEETGVFYVNLLADPAEDPFMLEPRRYYSADGLHPSSEGYGFYYTALLAQGRLGEYLGASALGVPSLAPA